MGTFKEKITLKNPARPDLEIEIECIVDTGATYTWIPVNELEKIGLKPQFTRKFKLADGKIVEREMAEVIATLRNESIHTLVAFGDVDSEPLLGAVTLEEFGLAPDPVNKTLVPVPALLLARTLVPN
jgi:clan AA aspartic protease